MICPKCHHENENGSMFCRYCGASMNPVPENESNTSSIIIFVWIIAVGVLSIITTLYTKFVDNWYEGSSRMVYIGIQIIHNIVMILPVFAIKNKTLKIVGIILMAGLIIWWVFNNISWALEYN